jgi:hypothetical protein
MRTQYGAADVVVVDDQSVNTVSSSRGSRLPALFGRSHKKYHQHSSNGDAATVTGIDAEEDNFENDEYNVTPSSSRAESKSGKLLDLESLIGLCVIRLNIPEEEEEEKDDEDVHSSSDIESGRLIKGPIEVDLETGLLKGQPRQVEGKSATKSQLKSFFKGMKKSIKNAARAVVTKPTLFLPMPTGFPKSEAATTEYEVGPEPESQCSICFATLCSPFQRAFIVLWGEMKTRVVMVPAGLLLLWILVVCIESAMFQPLRAVADLVLPQLALVLDVASIVVQCWICALPLAASLAKLAGKLQTIIDAAFGEMTQQVPHQIAKILLALKIPAMAAENVCKILFKPFATVLATIFKVIPQVDSIISKKAKDPKSLAPLVFVGLLIGLVFGQILLLLVIGSEDAKYPPRLINLICGLGLTLAVSFVRDG